MVIASHLDSPKPRRPTYTERVTWVLIAILIGLSYFAYISVLEKVGG
jgi:hypothetical protein